VRKAWIADGAAQAPTGFAYASNTNPERLDARALQSLLEARLSA
jgi:UDP-N-acetylglucosamine 4,6-dehydratase